MKLSQIESSLRLAILARCASLALVKNPLASRPVIGSRIDNTQTLSVVNPSTTEREIIYIVAELTDFEAVEPASSPDCPDVALTYAIHFFMQFVEQRPDDSTSTADFNRAVLELRELFDTDDEIIVDGATVRNDRLLLANSLTTDEPDSITGADGHSADFTLRVVCHVSHD